MSKSISAPAVRTYWRSRLIEHLQRPQILQEVMVAQDGRLDLKICDWDSYWRTSNLPNETAKGLDDLKQQWSHCITSSQLPRFSQKYCQSYFGLLEKALALNHHDLISRLACFENFCLTREDGHFPPVALTTNFRNPLFLFLALNGFRKHRRQDSRMVPLITAFQGNAPSLYYCLTRESLIKNSDHNLLIYINAGLENRSGCFDFLHSLEGILFSAQGQYLEERARRISSKVLLPLITNVLHSGGLSDEPVRILDIGSADGHLLGNIIADLSERLDTPVKFQVTLLDPSSLPEHLEPLRPQKPFLVHDLSQALGLRTNHFYCVCSNQADSPNKGKLIWPT